MSKNVEGFRTKKGYNEGNKTGLHAIGTMVLLQPLPVETKTESGLLLAPSVAMNERNRGVICKVIEIGPGCWTDQEHDFCEVGDWVLVGTYVGKFQKSYIDGKEYRLVRDLDILTFVEFPQEILDELEKGIVRSELRDYNAVVAFN